MNYVGEMMLYSSFAVLCQRTEVWWIYAYVWGFIFQLRMNLKEYSLIKKVDWYVYYPTKTNDERAFVAQTMSDNLS